ncbi:MAG: transporter, partial [Paenibacillus sp.]|nr:transporter [Paenibacillus sp.]
MGDMYQKNSNSGLGEMMKTLPKEMEAVLKQNRLTEEDLIYWMVCDRTTDGSFADTYVLLGQEALTIVSGGSPPALEKNYKGFVAKKKEKPQETVPSGPWTKETIGLGKVESVSVVNLVASGMIVIKEEEGERVVAAFTNGHMARAAKLASVFAKLKKNEELDLQELNEEQEQSSCPKCGMIYPEKGRQVCPKCLKKHAIFTRLLSFAGAYKSSIFLIVLFMLLNSATGLAIPYLQGTVLFDQALGGEGTFAGKIGLVILLIIGFRTISLLFGVLYGIIIAKLAANVSFDLKTSVFSAMQRLSLNFFQKKQTGQLMTRVNNDATELQYFFVDGMSYFIVNAMNIIGITAILLYLDWKLTLLCFIPLPIVFFIVRKVFPRLWRL